MRTHSRGKEKVKKIRNDVKLQEMEEKKSKRTSNDNWLTIFNGAIMVFTLAIAITSIITTCNASKEAKQTIQAMDSATRIENRAYLQMETPTGKRGLGIDTLEDSIFMAHIDIRNTGKTPAYNLRISYDCSSSPIPENTINFRYNVNGGGILGAGQLTTIRARPKDITFKEYYYGKKSLYYYGYISYDDFFQKNHTLTFYYKIAPEIYDLSIRDYWLNSLDLYVPWDNDHNKGD